MILIFDESRSRKQLRAINKKRGSKRSENGRHTPMRAQQMRVEGRGKSQVLAGVITSSTSIKVGWPAFEYVLDRVIRSSSLNPSKGF